MRAAGVLLVALSVLLLPDCGSLPRALVLPGPSATARRSPVVFCLRGGEGGARDRVAEGPEVIANELTSHHDLDLWFSVNQGDLIGVNSAVSLGADVNSPLDWLAEYLPESAVAFPTVPPSTSAKHRDCKPTGLARGWRPVHLASWLGMPEVVQALLAEGADARVASSTGTTPLHLAAHGLFVGGRSFGDAMTDYARVCELLVRAGAEVDSRDAVGWTPLLISARNNRPNLIIQLVDDGADPHARDKAGLGAEGHAKALDIHPMLQEATLQLLEVADAIKLRDENKERWHLGMTCVVWKWGVELTLHLFGHCFGFRMKGPGPHGESGTLSIFRGPEPWRFGKRMLKNGMPFGLRGQWQKIEIPADGPGENGRVADIEPKQEEPEKAAAGRRPPAGSKGRLAGEGGKQGGASKAAGDGRGLAASKGLKWLGLEGLGGEDSSSDLSRGHDSSATSAHSVKEREEHDLSSREGSPQPVIIETADSVSSFSSSGQDTTVVRSPFGALDDQTFAAEAFPEEKVVCKGPTPMAERPSPGDPGCARLSRRGIWSCMWCLFPGFGQVVRKDDVWDS